MCTVELEAIQGGNVMENKEGSNLEKKGELERDRTQERERSKFTNSKQKQMLAAGE